MARPIINLITVNELLNIFSEDLIHIHESTKYIRIRRRNGPVSRVLHSVKYGDFVVYSYDGKSDDNRQLFSIRFIKTGYCVHNIRIGQIETGNIKDLTAPKINKVGFLGSGYKELIETDMVLHRQLYERWRNMLHRCYNPKFSSYCRYGAVGVTVSDRWHNYSNFYKDAQTLPGFDRDKILHGHSLTLDKDKFQIDLPHNKRVYSKETCCWLTMAEQNDITYKSTDDKAHEVRRVYYKCITPDGEVVIGKGIASLSKKYNLDSGDCSRAIAGKIDHVKQFRFSILTEAEIAEFEKNRKLIRSLE